MDAADFLLLVGEGKLDEVRAAIAAEPALVNARGPHPFWGGRPQALHVAIETKRIELVELLLDAGADPNGSNDEYDLWSPWMLAIDRKSEPVQQMLRERGATQGLLESLMLGDDACLETLTELPAIAPNAGSLLAFARTPAALEKLLALGASTETADRWGSTPIDSFSRSGARGEPLMRMLIERGVPARPEYYARLGDQERLAAHTPEQLQDPAVMMGAVDFKRYELVRWLLSKGVSPNARTTAQSRHTALHSAAWNGDLEMARILVEGGADTLARDEQYGGTPEDWAETSVTVTNNPKAQAVAEYLGSL